MGYEEATKLFRRIDDEASPEYSKYTALVKKFVVDSNQIAQEKAVEATLAFVECAAAASKYVTCATSDSYVWDLHVHVHVCIKCTHTCTCACV